MTEKKTSNQREHTSILYNSSDQKTFILDIPTSIELAQLLPGAHARSPERKLYSTTVKDPYPCPPEPKTDAARSRVLARIPDSERVFLEAVDGFVKTEYEKILKERGFSGTWCYPRHVIPEEETAGEGSREKRKFAESEEAQDLTPISNSQSPPIILSASSVNEFSSLFELQGVQVRNPALQSAIIRVKHVSGDDIYTIPPNASFNLGALSTPSNQKKDKVSIIPNLPETTKFNLILLDPPWPNRSVRRSSQYHTHTYLEMDSLTVIMQGIFHAHLNREDRKKAVVGIWTTNSAKSRQAAYSALESANLQISEEWIWLKVTENGEPVLPLDGLWRKPYEVLLIGTPKTETGLKGSKPLKRLLVAVSDIHSRKPNLKELFENLFFSTHDTIQTYTALEVFARTLTSGWYSCGNDVLRFNGDQWWSEP
ncbi:hypothetical protein PISL3812_07633 [Talaromyces islandicus]|uniref:Methyltransferase-like protein 4 n=1 Tax=Talaromyces islandicus TaxID=28573 RepID=A0A0U1M4S5_TALIS|nr:hypothetical protein PISL3812_07633 [Talaromyces islandicus]